MNEILANYFLESLQQVWSDPRKIDILELMERILTEWEHFGIEVITIGYITANDWEILCSLRVEFLSATMPSTMPDVGVNSS